MWDKLDNFFFFDVKCGTLPCLCPPRSNVVNRMPPMVSSSDAEDNEQLHQFKLKTGKNQSELPDTDIQQQVLLSNSYELFLGHPMYQHTVSTKRVSNFHLHWRWAIGDTFITQKASAQMTHIP